MYACVGMRDTHRHTRTHTEADGEGVTSASTVLLLNREEMSSRGISTHTHTHTYVYMYTHRANVLQSLERKRERGRGREAESQRLLWGKHCNSSLSPLSFFLRRTLSPSYRCTALTVVSVSCIIRVLSPRWLAEREGGAVREEVG